jgi:hypothetical protein
MDDMTGQGQTLKHSKISVKHKIDLCQPSCVKTI